ncbi:MAG: ATP-binding protein [Erysipelotrichaceae bacterium]|nr:ATP-binding protein [Erysipelotrichaceae bacterium]
MSFRKILGSLRKADQDYDLINTNDKIAVGISGGKDSVLLLHALILYRRYVKKDYKIIAISIDVGFDNDLSDIKQYFEELEIEFIIEKTKIKDILSKHLVKGRLDCSLCSTLKKGALVKIAKEHGCNKIALGHNSDDAIETLLLNQIYGGKIATFSPSQYLSNENITLIRPFVYVHENDIKETVIKLSLPIVKSNCPVDGFTKRQAIKELLDSIYKTYPEAKKNFLHMLSNHENVLLWTKKDKD